MSDYVAYLLDLLESYEGVSARRMFGGHGLFRHGLMFGLVADDMLYLKVDDETRGDFEARGLEPFVYQKKGKPVALGYYQAPEEALETSEELRGWSQRAFAVAVRAKG